jgi:predicted RNA binding protein YcfA (HicA-like mRNA interferase family)
LTKIPVIPAKKVERILFGIGFQKMRQKGSHVFYKHHDGRVTTVPFHKGRDISPVLLKKILKDINMPPEEFIQLLNA